MKNNKSLLKEKPEYEDYSDNIYYSQCCATGGLTKEKSCCASKGNGCCRKGLILKKS